MIITIFILTILDVALTTIGLECGYVVEANPIIVRLIEVSLPWTMAGVLVFTAFALILINRFNYKWVRYGLYAVLTTKIFVMVAHFIWIGQVILCLQILFKLTMMFLPPAH